MKRIEVTDRCLHHVVVDAMLDLAELVAAAEIEKSRLDTELRNLQTKIAEAKERHFNLTVISSVLLSTDPRRVAVRHPIDGAREPGRATADISIELETMVPTSVPPKTVSVKLELVVREDGSFIQRRKVQ